MTGTGAQRGDSRVCHTSGPFTDPEAAIDLRKGLAPLRKKWIETRGDTEPLDSQSSAHSQQRMADEGLDHLRSQELSKPRRAKAGNNVTQMHYARQGIITPSIRTTNALFLAYLP